MLYQLILRIIYAAISAAILAIASHYIYSRFDKLPRLLRDRLSSGANRKGHGDAADLDDRKPKEGARRSTRPPKKFSDKQRRLRRVMAYRRRSRASCESYGKRSVDKSNDANVRDRKFSQPRNK